MYIFVCIYVYICVCVCIYIYIYIYICVVPKEGKKVKKKGQASVGAVHARKSMARSKASKACHNTTEQGPVCMYVLCMYVCIYI